MADRILLESGAPDGYLLEDSSGVLLLEGPVAQAGFLSRPVGGLRRMGATSGGGPVVARALFLPLLGVA